MLALIFGVLFAVSFLGFAITSRTKYSAASHLFWGVAFIIFTFRKMKQKSKDRIFSEYPCADFLHNALHFLARNKPEFTYGEICYALLKSGNKLTDEEQKIFDNYRKTGQLEMMSDDNIDDWEDTK